MVISWDSANVSGSVPAEMPRKVASRGFVEVPVPPHLQVKFRLRSMPCWLLEVGGTAQEPSELFAFLRWS